jgi:BirA family biotin operon repressor/biotin-[acetyl-CoA-carboxylase] ligase
VPVGIKWPNDIIVDQKKICGILLEIGAISGQAAYLNIGIGVNVNNEPALELTQASSLKRITGQNIPRKKILAAFMDSFDLLTRELSQQQIISQLKALHHNQ